MKQFIGLLALVAANGLIDRIIANIGVPDGLPGLAVASPSRHDPDYYYHWIRDGALTIGALVNEYALNSDNDALRTLIDDYVRSSEILQQTPNQSGGLGEPKFYVDGSAFNGPWGRPQNDGPALRALVVSKWAVLQSSRTLEDLYWGTIRDDATYITRVWAQPSFDLWEEYMGFHLFTSVVQWGALKAAAVVASELGLDSDASEFRKHQAWLGSFISSKFIDPDHEHICEHYPCSGRGRSGVDAATVLAALEVEDLAGWTYAFDDEPILINSTSPAIQRTVDLLIQDGIDRFPINNGGPGGIGRYPEDVYDGVGQSKSNAWFLCTAGVAEALVHAEKYEQAALHYWFIGQHRGRDGTMSEQIDLYSGYMRGAENLTWSYSALYRSKRAAELAGYPELGELAEPPTTALIQQRL